MDKEDKRMIKALLAAGAEVRRTGKNHLRVTYKGQYVTTIASTLGDKTRGRKNNMAQIKRAGILI